MKVERDLQYKRFDLDEYGVIIIVPVTHHMKIGLRVLPLTWRGEMWQDEQIKASGRYIMNFELYDEDKPDEPLDSYDAPIEIWVRYTAEDRKRKEDAGEDESMLVFWDGEQWVAMDEDKHHYSLVEGAETQYLGFGVASIEYWGDPRIAWIP